MRLLRIDENDAAHELHFAPTEANHRIAECGEREANTTLAVSQHITALVAIVADKDCRPHVERALVAVVHDLAVVVGINAVDVGGDCFHLGVGIGECEPDEARCKAVARLWRKGPVHWDRCFNG